MSQRRHTRSVHTRSLKVWISIGLSMGWMACKGSDMPPDGGDEPGMALSVDELMQPQTCKECHPGHYREWASSMHAYATKDPVFRAMNARGQEETNMELKTFCVNCHAPLATSLGMITNGTNDELDALDPEFASVNCYFCHNIAEVPQEFDNGLGLPANNPFTPAMDTVMRGGLKDPVKPPAHDVAYSPMMDGDLLESANLCGPCHDIVTPAPANFHLEQTFQEWRGTSIAKPSTTGNSLSCNSCHMDGFPGLAAKTDEVQVGFRNAVHEHLFVGVDVALTDHPDRELQMRAIQCKLNDTIHISTLQVGTDGILTIIVETDVGHGFPTGATQDRRVWLEIKIIDRAGNERYIGRVADDETVVDVKAEPGNEAMPTYFHTLLDENGEETHDFWEANDRTGQPIKPPNPGDHSLIHNIPIYNLAAPEETWPARVEVIAHVRPVGRDVIEDLVSTGHLADDSILQLMPTFTASGSFTVWDMNENELDEQVRNAIYYKPLPCPAHYRCLLDGSECP